MGLRINTNISAINAHNLLQANDANLSKSLERLSSGLRINKASDDAAGLAISQKLTAQVQGLNQASANAQDGINLLQTAEGGLNETENILQRMRELAVKGANDTMTASDRSNINDEMLALASEVDRIAAATQFNTSNLLNGGATFTFQIGANAGQLLNVTIDTANTSALTVAATNLCVGSASFASAAIANVDSAIAAVSQFRSRIGANVNRLEHTISNLNVQSQNLDSSRSSIRDLDMAAEATNMSREQILTQSSQAMLAQANQSSQGVLSLLR